MKKLLIAGTIIGMILLVGAGILVEASANPPMKQNGMKKMVTDPNLELTNETLALPSNGFQIKCRGAWGYEGSNQTKGYVGGILTVREKGAALRGRFNMTGNDTKQKVVCVLRKGYLNGRIIIDNTSVYRIVGLYRYDKDAQILHIRWMTAEKTGWAHLRILTA
jgi:hypothetical protein